MTDIYIYDTLYVEVFFDWNMNHQSSKSTFVELSEIQELKNSLVIVIAGFAWKC